MIESPKPPRPPSRIDNLSLGSSPVTQGAHRKGACRWPVLASRSVISALSSLCTRMSRYHSSALLHVAAQEHGVLGDAEWTRQGSRGGPALNPGALPRLLCRATPDTSACLVCRATHPQPDPATQTPSGAYKRRPHLPLCAATGHRNPHAARHTLLWPQPGPRGACSSTQTQPQRASSVQTPAQCSLGQDAQGSRTSLAVLCTQVVQEMYAQGEIPKGGAQVYVLAICDGTCPQFAGSSRPHTGCRTLASQIPGASSIQASGCVHTEAYPSIQSVRLSKV